MALIERVWYPAPGSVKAAIAHVMALPLLPLSWLFRLIAIQRHRRYQRDVEAGAVWRPPVPVIVVGNINVGGTGKTPVVIALLEELSALGFRPGVVSRGYGGEPNAVPLLVESDTSPVECGDEPLLIRQRTDCPVVVDPKRPDALRHLLASTDVDVVVSDDGLQHYRLYRDYEVAVVDSQRGLGNGLCLPAGPLREPPARLTAVDAILLNGEGHLPAAPSAQSFTLRPTAFVGVVSGERRSLASFVEEFGAVHAIAGIGNPMRFFDTLTAQGLRVDGRAFPDHHQFCAADIDYVDAQPVIMTEKDAVKCRPFANQRHWYLSVDAQLPERFLKDFRQSIPRQSTPRY